MRTLCGQDYVKDLSRLGRSMSRTVLVDNDPFSGLLQPCNVLPTRAFHGEASDRCRHLRLASPAYLGTYAEELCLHGFTPALDSYDTLCLYKTQNPGGWTLSLYCGASLSDRNRAGFAHKTCLTEHALLMEHLALGRDWSCTMVQAADARASSVPGEAGCPARCPAGPD